jgi:hypothetical protein
VAYAATGVAGAGADTGSSTAALSTTWPTCPHTEHSEPLPMSGQNSHMINPLVKNNSTRAINQPATSVDSFERKPLFRASP